VQQSPAFTLDGRSVDTGVHEYEVPEPSTATVLARFTNTPGQTPAITVNRFGKGEAIYLATEPKPSAIGPLLDSLYSRVGVQRGPQTPDGVYARVVDGRTLYVNTTDHQQRIPLSHAGKGLITGRLYHGEIVLDPWQVDLVQ
jgi:beta-galactosidase